MTHRHSEPYSFEIEMHGKVHNCAFSLFDDRLITVVVADRKRTSALGTTPPRALAITIATELIHELEALARQPEQKVSWVGKLLDRFGKAEERCADPDAAGSNPWLLRGAGARQPASP